MSTTKSSYHFLLKMKVKLSLTLKPKDDFKYSPRFHVLKMKIFSPLKYLAFLLSVVISFDVSYLSKTSDIVPEQYDTLLNAYPNDIVIAVKEFNAKSTI